MTFRHPSQALYHTPLRHPVPVLALQPTVPDSDVVPAAIPFAPSDLSILDTLNLSHPAPPLPTMPNLPLNTGTTSTALPGDISAPIFALQHLLSTSSNEKTLAHHRAILPTIFTRGVPLPTIRTLVSRWVRAHQLVVPPASAERARRIAEALMLPPAAAGGGPAPHDDRLAGVVLAAEHLLPLGWYTVSDIAPRLARVIGVPGGLDNYMLVDAIAQRVLSRLVHQDASRAIAGLRVWWEDAGRLSTTAAPHAATVTGGGGRGVTRRRARAREEDEYARMWRARAALLAFVPHAGGRRGRGWWNVCLRDGCAALLGLDDFRAKSAAGTLLRAMSKPKTVVEEEEEGAGSGGDEGSGGEEEDGEGMRLVRAFLDDDEMLRRFDRDALLKATIHMGEADQGRYRDRWGELAGSGRGGFRGRRRAAGGGEGGGRRQSGRARLRGAVAK